MDSLEKQYLDLLNRVLTFGQVKSNRTGVNTYSLFGESLKCDLRDGFPLLSTKRVNFHAVAVELLWLISGSTNIRPLVLQNVNIWNEWPFKRWAFHENIWAAFSTNRQENVPGWKAPLDAFVQKIKNDEKFAEEWGELGPVYGHQWRSWEGQNGQTFDQLAQAIALLKTDPHSRRIIVNSWHVDEIPGMLASGLPPCHYTFQFYALDSELSCEMSMRSADLFLGVPFNIASYALLTHLVGLVTGLTPTYLKINMTDAHIYMNHVQQVGTQIKRGIRTMPTIALLPKADIDQFELSDITLLGYNPHPALKGEVAI